MANWPVDWHEGLFLRPHHFQAAQRHWSHLADLSERWDHHYNWGLRSVRINRYALENYRLVVESLAARLRDGTLISIPEDGVLNEVDLRPLLKGRSEVAVSLGVPVFSPGRKNLAGDDPTGGVRYLPETKDVEDENSGRNLQRIKFRRLNVRLLTSAPDKDLTGYEVVPIAWIEVSDHAVAKPRLNQKYIPPVVACDAWHDLQVGILQALYDRIGQKLKSLAALVHSRNINFGSLSHDATLSFAQLREFNEAYSMLGVLAFADGIHPLKAYMELCRMVGQLAVFGEARRSPDLPRYDHDDLGRCFYGVKEHIDLLIDVVPDLDYEEAPFIGSELRMQVKMEPDWLNDAGQLFIGVETSMNAEECVNFLSSLEKLAMKVGSHDRVDDIFSKGKSGLSFKHVPTPPPALPHQGLVYFQIDRDTQQEEWRHVKRAETLAIRLNKNLIHGSIQDQRVLTIKTNGQAARSGPVGQTVTMQFTLYALSK